MPVNACCCGSNNTDPCFTGCCQIYALHVLQINEGTTIGAEDDQLIGHSTGSAESDSVAVFVCPIPSDTNGGIGMYGPPRFKWDTQLPFGGIVLNTREKLDPVSGCPHVDPVTAADSSWEAIGAHADDGHVMAVRCCDDTPGESPDVDGAVATISNIIGVIQVGSTTATPTKIPWSGQLVKDPTYGWVPPEQLAGLPTTLPDSSAVEMEDGTFADGVTFSVSAAIDVPSGVCLSVRFSMSGAAGADYKRVGGDDYSGKIEMANNVNLTRWPLYAGITFS